MELSLAVCKVPEVKCKALSCFLFSFFFACLTDNCVKLSLKCVMLTMYMCTFSLATSVDVVVVAQESLLELKHS